MGHSTALPKGFRIGEFEILRVLGQGGFGVTYLAYDHEMDKSVAIKEYFPVEWARRGPENTVVCISEKSEEMFNWGLVRFLEEARTMAKFEHPSIVRATRHIRASGTAYIIMDFVEGETLGDVLNKNKTLPADKTRYLIESLLDGLRETHQLDILHRDIKPSNVLIRADSGRPVLIDFGAARQTIQKQSAPITAIVTPPYAPPEQYTTQQHKQGPWTDLYSICVLAYECLTGRQPPDGPGRIEGDPIEWLDENAHGDPDLCRAINAGLQVPTTSRPGDIDAWLSISGMHYIGDAPGGANSRRPAENGPTKLRDKPSPPFRTNVRPHAPAASGDPKGRGMIKYGAIAAAALVVLIGGGAVVSGSFSEDTTTPIDEPGISRFAEASTTTNTPTSTISDANLPDTFKDQTDLNKLMSSMPTMHRVPAGSFQMGSSPGDSGYSNKEGPQHTVTFDYDFAISETEITLGQWRACSQNGPCLDIDKQTASNGEMPMKNQPDDYPVRLIYMSDIANYLQYLSEHTGKSYRLPTEAEWEYAAGAGKSLTYPWGDRFRSAQANCGDCNPGGVTLDDVVPVKSYPPNGLGLYDMAGNVREVVSDCWTENFSSSPRDGSASMAMGCKRRTVKGGDFKSKTADMRVASRAPFEVISDGREGASQQVGFRVVRTLNK